MKIEEPDNGYLKGDEMKMFCKPIAVNFVTALFQRSGEISINPRYPYASYNGN